MTTTSIYRPIYEKSWALVIGINKYSAAPLGYARQDAEGFADALVANFGFPKGNVTTLFDEAASRKNILSTFLGYVAGTSPDDRLAIFFAGHGCTQSGRRGEVGYLVPVDGDPSDLSSLIRWDELTRNAELVPAKHVIFLMDACYGGLAITRTLAPGSARFLKDMLQRYSRQVLTAGKADETVADAGGPRPGHSIFTGHLLDALDGKAVSPDGIISANAVMAYVYDRVSKDPHSRQSPHFGFFEGDGDFIFAAPDLAALTTDDQVGTDVLVQIPASLAAPAEPSEGELFLQKVKQYLSDPRHQIQLDDLIANEVRAVLHMVRDEQFPLQTTTVTPEEFAERLKKYEAALSRLRAVTILLARWGTDAQQPMLARIISRLVDSTEQRSGKVIWLGLRWYPIMLLQYSGGIAALTANNYASLATLLTTKTGTRSTGHESQAAVVATVEAILEVERSDIFKRLPGHERQFTPRSEYLFTALQPELEDLLFLGNSYEELFDRFEVFYALVYADMTQRDLGRIWGPPGRFGWKGIRGHSGDPYQSLLDEANQRGSSWPPLAAGLFGGSLERFNEIATSYREKLLKALPWY